MYLEDYYFCRTQTQMHGRFHRKALSNTNLRKRIRETPTKSFQNKQGTLGH
jgi:hypothetical protein